MRAGDILLAVNGEPVVISNEVSVLKDSMSVGETVILTIWRDGSEFDVDVLLMDMNDLY